MAVLIAGYEIDVALSEDHAFDSEVTVHPVEVGADIADHARARPITVALEGIVSDTPIGDLASRRQQFTLINGEAFARPSEEAFAFLQAIRDAREPVSIETSLRSYDNMMLQSLSVPRSTGNGDALRFRATFVQVELVTNERTTVRVAVPNAAKKVQRGNKPSPEVGTDPVSVSFGVLADNSPTPAPVPVGANAQGRRLNLTSGGRFSEQ